MGKSIFSSDYDVFLRHLREARKRAGLTQVELGERLGETQSFISKCERGERRVDVVELRCFANAMGLSFIDFVSRLEANLRNARKRQGSNK